MATFVTSAEATQRDSDPGVARAATFAAMPASKAAFIGHNRPGVRRVRPSLVPAFATQDRSFTVADVNDPLETEARATADRFAGQQEPTDVRERMERAFNFDFSGVRLHSDQQAAESARGLGAAAFTVGTDIVLGPGVLSAPQSRRSWLLAHELAHVMQHTDGRGERMLHRQPELVPELDRQLSAAVTAGDWKQAAQILNRFTPEDIDRRIGKVPGWTGRALSKGQTAAVYTGALENNLVGKDSNVANHTRWAYLDKNYENELARGHWDRAAYFLNGFSEPDIRVRLDNFGGNLTQLQALLDGALASVGPTSGAATVTDRYIRRLNLEARVEAMQKTGELNLPVSTAGSGTSGQPAYIAMGQSGSAPAVAETDREPLSPTTDWSKDSDYIDNDISLATYDIGTNRLEIIYTDGQQLDLDYDSVRKFAGSLPPPRPIPPPPPIAAPAPAVFRPSPPAPASLPPQITKPESVAGGEPPQREAAERPAALGERGLYFKAKSTGRIYPTMLNKGTIPTISACVLEIAQQEPEARERMKEAMISVAVNARGAATAVISAAARVPLFSLGARRRSGAQFFLKNVYEAEVRASQRGYQVYEYFAEDGRCLYVGKAGGAGGVKPTTWVDRGWDHIDEKPEIAEASSVRITASLSEQEAFALEEVRIGQVRGTPGNLNTKPGEYTGRWGSAGLSDNAASAVKRPTYEFECDIMPYSPKPVRR